MTNSAGVAHQRDFKQAAAKVHSAVNAVRMHVKHIYAKLHVLPRSEATAKYQQKSPFGRS
jgi:DNA-binding NarL/FixJ family response regulator